MPAINVVAVIRLIEEAEEAALERVANVIAADAKARAPVRKVFKEKPGFRRRFRPLTPLERNLAIRRAMAYRGYDDFQRRRSVAYLQNYARAEIKRPGSNNSLAKSRTLRLLGRETSVKRTGGGSTRSFNARVDAVRNRKGGFESQFLNPLMTSRGRYEVKSGRAIHREAGKTGVNVRIGGKLKASIENEGVTHTPDGVEARVTAGIGYAKFVEFPTIHNAAQPFLLPALHGARTLLKREVAAEIKNLLGG